MVQMSFECFLNYLLFILMCMYFWCSTNKIKIQIKSKTFKKRNFKNKSRPCKANSQELYLHFLVYIMFGFVFLFFAFCKYLSICQSVLCGASRRHAHCNCFGALSLDHLVRLRQWEHSKNREPRVNIILKHLFLHGPIFLVLLFVYMFSFVLKFCLCVEQKYMHIAIVVLLFLLHILSLSSFLIPFLTHCKQLLFTENKIIYCWISKTVQNQYNKWIKEATWKQSDVKWSLIQWRETD